MSINGRNLQREVDYYQPVDGKLLCTLCPHHCKLREGQIGVCRQRQRVGEKLFALNYAEVASMAVDPVEKKPLYHFRPGSAILSVGANGCNLKCLFCQNCEISQGHVPTQLVPVDELVKIAGTRGSIGVAFTYSEPLMWYEYVFDAAPLLKKQGYAVVLVTNGFIDEEPLRRLLPFIDAMNIDLKSPTEEFYRKLCKGRLEPVQRSIRLSHEAGVHLEVTHLVVTGRNDNLESIVQLAKWLASVDPEIPLHLSRYFPHYRYAEPPTSVSFLREAFKLARKELKFVYLGNLAAEEGTNSYCPNCDALLVERWGYRVKVVQVNGNTCGQCGRIVPFR